MSIKEQWESYAQGVLPANAPEVQVQETRRAFYAGVWAMLQLAKVEVGGEGKGTRRRLDAVERECRAFQQDVLKGRA